MASIVQVVIWEGIVALVQQNMMDHAFMTCLNDWLNLSLNQKQKRLQIFVTKLGLLKLNIIHEDTFG